MQIFPIIYPILFCCFIACIVTALGFNAFLSFILSFVLMYALYILEGGGFKDSTNFQMLLLYGAFVMIPASLGIFFGTLLGYGIKVHFEAKKKLELKQEEE